MNLYGPNKDDPKFYENIQQKIVRQGNENIIIVGDWNLLLDPPIDSKNYKHVNNPSAREIVLKLMSDLNLYDIWREENREKHMFTWKRKLKPGLIQMGRLDFFFIISEKLATFSKNENISPGYRSDHSIISLCLKFISLPKSRTYWKFNNYLLLNIDYSKEIKNTITRIKSQYAPPQTNPEEIENKRF